MQFLFDQRTRLKMSLLAASTAMAMLFAGGGCVDDVGLVDRTGPNKVDKTALEGVWLYVATVADAPYSQASAFTGLMNFGDQAKVIFDIQEQYLVAYTVVEKVTGTEEGYKKQPIRKYWDPNARDEFVELYVGTPIARWPITKHFDMIRNYNTFNGAQSNEVVENTVDRPWYQRDYMRVAWERQEIGSFFFGVGQSNAFTSYLVGDQHALEPDAMVIDPDSGYMDHVIRVMVDSLGGWACNVWDLSQYDCTAAEVKVRHSFKRLDPKRDYQPIRYHNSEHMDLFGFFLTERNTVNPDWGASYAGRVSYANRWNLWRNNFDYIKPTDEQGNELTVACFSDTDCDQDAEQRCQKDKSWFTDGYCAVAKPRAYTERTLKPIVYWLNTDWPEEFLDTAYVSADAWNDVFKDAVAWKLFYEEIGLGSVRSCDTHADCTLDTMLLDEELTVTDSGISCYADADCSAVQTGATCGAGYCEAVRTCGAGDPCAVGQSCSGGLCLDASGSSVMQRLNAAPQRGNSVVYYGGGAITTVDNFSNTTLQPLVNDSSLAFVRFIHAAPEGGNLSLRIGSTTIAGGGFDAERNYDPQNPATADFMAAVPSTSEVDVEVTSGGTVVATVKASIVAQSNYLAIYNGQDVFVVGADFNQSSFGIRFIHAAANGGPVDYAVEGVRTDEAVGYRNSTEFRTIAGDAQRVTLSVHGSRGDLTCHRDDTIGRCIGWGPTIGDDEKARVQSIKEGLPDMFVLCQNQFDALAAFEEGKAGNREELSDARYSTGDYNPCGDPTLVAYPEEPKKIGDTRYSMFYWVNEAMRSGPLGYGPSAADPHTGEIIYAQANIYGASLRTYSQYAGDLLDLVNGDLDPTTVITGGHVRDFLKAKAEDTSDPDQAAYFGAMAGIEQTEDAHKKAVARKANRFQRHALDHRMPTHAHMHPGTQPNTRIRKHDYEFPELMEYMRNPAKLKADLELMLPQVDPQMQAKRLAKLEGTWIEDLLISNEIAYAATHVDPFGDLQGEDLKDAISPIRAMTKQAIREHEARQDILMQNNIYMAEFADDAIYGLAKEMKKRAEDEGLTPAQVRIEVGKAILDGVLRHEIGHTVGLRHNFGGSTDVFNFHDEYYSIREQEPILCREDSWCDDNVGEICALQECTQSEDCFGGQECILDNNTNRFLCSTPNQAGSTTFVPTGVCSAFAGDAQCTQASECGADEYCDTNGRCVKPNVQFVPRSHMTPNERIQKITQYQYTSTMDYGARFNSDVEGLGKYDYAAIKFGYTELHDVYSDTEKLRARIDKLASQTGQTSAYWSFQLNTRQWPNRGTGFWHPFNYLNNYIGVEQNLKRHPVPYEQIRYQRDMVQNDVRELNDIAYIPVNYAFCSDEFRGNMGCYIFDQGVDAGEMAANARMQLEQYYIFDAFKRERMWFGKYGNPMSYYFRIMSRYFPVLSDVGMFYALWDSFLFRYAWYEEWKNMPMGGRMLNTAANEAFGDLRDTVSSPAPGCYVENDEGNYTHMTLNLDEEYCASQNGLYVPFGVGRYPHTTFGDAFGHQFFEHPLWFGSFWEKFAALQTLTDNTAYFVDLSVGEQLNIGAGTSLGFNTVFATEMNEFLGGIISGHLPAYAGRVQGGKYVAPSIPGRTADDPSVEPSLNNFTLKLWSSVYGLAFLPAGFDPQFIERLAVYVEGEATYTDKQQPGIVKHTFEDPIGGKTYVAFTTNYGLVTERVDVAADMVQAAQALADQWETAQGIEKQQLEQQLHEKREMLDVLRNLHQVFGTSTLGF